MFYYIGFTLLSLLNAVIIKKVFGFEKKKTLKLFISILPLTLLSAFRYDVGWDYLNIYTIGYYLVGQYHMHWFTEGGFLLLIKVLYNLFHNPISLFIVMSFLTAYFFSKTFNVYGDEKNVLIYIILYVLTRYYFCSLNIIRQALSMMIILYALHFLKEKKYFKYFIYIVFSMTFHYLTIMYIPLGLLLNKDFKKKRNIVMLICVIPILLVLLIIFLYNTKYMVYIKSNFANDGTLLYSELLISAILVFSAIMASKNVDKENSMHTIFFNMEMIVFILSLFTGIIPVADRIIWYFTMQNIYFIPLILNSIKNKKNKLTIGFMIYASLTLVFLAQTVLGDSYAILPYHSIFTQ